MGIGKAKGTSVLWNLSGFATLACTANFSLGRDCNMQCSVKQMSLAAEPLGKGEHLVGFLLSRKTVLEFCGLVFDTMISNVQYPIY